MTRDQIKNVNAQIINQKAALSILESIILINQTFKNKQLIIVDQIHKNNNITYIKIYSLDDFILFSAILSKLTQIWIITLELTSTQIGDSGVKVSSGAFHFNSYHSFIFIFKY